MKIKDINYRREVQKYSEYSRSQKMRKDSKHIEKPKKY